MPDAAEPQNPRIPGGEREATSSTVDSRNPPTQNAFYRSAHSKPLLLRGLGSKAFLGRDVCMWLLLWWAFLPSTQVGSDEAVHECGNSSCQTVVSTTQINTNEKQKRQALCPKQAEHG